MTPASPLHRKVKDSLLRKIKKEELRIGERIPTTKELCAEFGVSSVTVRRAVLELVNEGYLKGVQGSGISVVKSGDEPYASRDRIGILFPDFTANPFYGEIFKGIEDVLELMGMQGVVATTRHEPAREGGLVKKFLQDKAKGVILTPTLRGRREEDTARLAGLAEHGAPMALIDLDIPDVRASFVSCDNFQGGYIGCKHLLELGHKRIGAIFIKGVPSFEDRLEGMKCALREAGLETSPELLQGVKWERDDVETGRLNALSLLDSPERPTAIFAFSDILGIGAYKACQSLALLPGEDVSILGFDDNHSRLSSPSMSSVAQPLHEIGRTAARTLLEDVFKRTQPQRVKLPCSLVVRNSTSKPKGVNAA